MQKGRQEQRLAKIGNILFLVSGYKMYIIFIEISNCVRRYL
jgi:hypothetical protein